MSWIGEVIFARMFGIRGMKVVAEKLYDLENRVRALEGNPAVTKQQVYDWLDGKMAEFVDDDSGPEPWES